MPYVDPMTFSYSECHATVNLAQITHFTQISATETFRIHKIPTTHGCRTSTDNDDTPIVWICLVHATGTGQNKDYARTHIGAGLICEKPLQAAAELLALSIPYFSITNKHYISLGTK